MKHPDLDITEEIGARSLAITANLDSTDIIRIISACVMSEICIQISDMVDLKQLILDRLGQSRSGRVWTPVDFLDLGNRDAVDKTLQRFARAGHLRRIDRGLYDVPRINTLTKKPAVPDYRQIIDAVARRDQVRMLVDGLTAANDLGLTTAVPSHVVIHTDARRRSIQLDKLKIDFKHTAPSKLYWAGRPGMRVVQALHWLKDTLPSDRDRVVARLSSILDDAKHGKAIRDDLRQGISTLPAWMQGVVRDLIQEDADRAGARRRSKSGRPRALRKPIEAPRP